LLIVFLYVSFINQRAGLWQAQLLPQTTKKVVLPSVKNISNTLRIYTGIATFPVTLMTFFVGFVIPKKI
jgi:hypothetical protein